eukprot:GCRY01000356.1.p1 GENE.GCRY01000356.1~~GCRY01000356.1.p1  ORF type:complete len:674 (+),score=156.18 GCRY01000356.1:301-2022(+)
MKNYSTSSINHQKQLQQLKPLPGTIGTGVDLTTGQLKLPVIQLTYENPNRTWTNTKGQTFRLPAEATFEPVMTGLQFPTENIQLFQTMAEYAKSLFQWGPEKKGYGGFFVSQADLQNVWDTYLKGTHGFTIAQELYPLYKFNLLVNPSSDTKDYQLDPYCKLALESLPPDYSTAANKKLYDLFIQTWGTSYTTMGVNGGIAEQLAPFDLSLLYRNIGPGGKPMTEAGVTAEASVEFLNNIGVGGGRAPAPEYTAHRQLLAIGCLGGNPEKSCSAKTIPQWKDSILNDPIALEFTVGDISELVDDLTTRENIQRALETYVQNQLQKWENIDTCPTCKWGSCEKPAHFCTCANEHITGQKCDICFQGWTGDKCTTPVCDKCVGGKCVGPNQCQCDAHHTGIHCDACVSGWSGKNCASPICPGGCGHGKCVAPGSCKCDSHYGGANCDHCNAEWHGPDCNEQQTCFKCHGTGKVCPDTELDCMDIEQVQCSGCGGTGHVPDNVQACFKCHGSGHTCPDSDPFSCMAIQIQQCSGCQGKGNIPDTKVKCPNCHGTGVISEMGGFFHECGKCFGRGYV